MMLRTVQPTKRQSRDGVALIFAITLLSVFSLLGASYIMHASIEVQDANYGVRKTRARMLAQAGVNAALGNLTEAIELNAVENVLGDAAFKLPTYDLQQTGANSIALDKLDDRIAIVDVTITDESGKVNLNHAPASVLRLLLGIDGAKARGITASLPHGNEGAWLVGVEDLLTRGLLSEEEYAAIDTSLITTYSVIDHDAPAAWLNINTAPPEVMAAVLGISVSAAEQVGINKPYADLAELAAASGKDPATFNVKPNPANPKALPVSLALHSNCFRIRAQATYGPTNETKVFPQTTATIEAVVIFTDAEKYEIVHWQVHTAAVAQTVTQETPDAEASEAV